VKREKERQREGVNRSATAAFGVKAVFNFIRVTERERERERETERERERERETGRQKQREREREQKNGRKSWKRESVCEPRREQVCERGIVGQ